MNEEIPLSLSYVRQQNGKPTPAKALTVRFSSAGFDREVHFHCGAAALRPTGDALFCLGLIPAMELGIDLRINADVDERLMANAARIQALLCQWYPGYRPIAISANTTRRNYPASRGTGLFYSGGVDSSYSLTCEHERLSALVTVVGADVNVEDKPRVERLTAMTKYVSSAFDLRSIFVTTDIRRVSDRLVGWVEYHGAFLAAVRHFLADEFDNQLIASSADESSWNRRWGSHPGLDPLWGTDGARFEHHGLVHRTAKLQRICDEPVLMKHLRVCNRRFEHCGVCDSCNFMNAALNLLGTRSKAPTYQHLGPTRPSLCVTGEGSLSDLKKMRAMAVENGGHADLVAAIDRALIRYWLKKTLLRVLPADEIARRFKRAKRQWRFQRERNKT